MAFNLAFPKPEVLTRKSLQGTIHLTEVQLQKKWVCRLERATDTSNMWELVHLMLNVGRYCPAAEADAFWFVLSWSKRRLTK